MKICRYQDRQGRIGYGVLTAEGSVVKMEGDLFEQPQATTEVVEVQRLLAPLVPPAILCLGLNYRRHAEESGMAIPRYPVLFMKTPGSIQHPDAPILLPTHLKSEMVDWECELAVVIGRSGKNIPPQQALGYVLGYTCANDVSARDWQLSHGAGQWCRGKTFDTFCPLGPYLVTTDEIPHPDRLAIRTLLNGAVVQDSNTADMIFGVAETIAFLSGSTTLAAGTVILTGTPQGVGMASQPPRYLKPGDTVAVQIEGIGTLTNPVRLEA